MKFQKLLLAATLATSAAFSHAAVIANYYVGLNFATSGLATGGGSGSGSAILDSNGTLTVDLNILNDQPTAGGTFYTHEQLVYQGTLTASNYVSTGGIWTQLGCSAGTISCPLAIAGAQPKNLTATPSSGNGGGLLESSFNINGGVNSYTFKTFAGQLTNHFSVCFAMNSVPQPEPGFDGQGYCTAPPAVPLPASTWMFGSGLFSLFAVARRNVKCWWK